MFWIGLGFFSFYTLLQYADEFYFHRRRHLPRMERHLRSLNSFLVAAAIGYTLFVEFDSETTMIFYAIAAASFFGFPLMEIDKRSEVSGGERFLHGILSMLHPQMLVLLATVWRFIDGAGFFMNIVLPFKTYWLRPLSYGYFGAMTFLFLNQFVYWNFLEPRKQKLIEPALTPLAPPMVAEVFGPPEPARQDIAA